ncbi:divergent polysaccharide deacetylase family protein [Rhodovulum sulfidophilum]|uniref:divergent polysaccharide deacetylase family protein n=1 Tax=Rhodovulum sulfidophilum TaxID=35806 RepID=UPI000952F6D1|nr:divergent polysaccharide deacetylase family protein [Rhodovulum sulfidophilum]OLS48384.1 hypothetical protein BV379_08925 [Rhodovulum sulfidophilum]
MGRGFFGGVLWGAATSGLALAALAVVVPPGTEPLDEARGEAPAPRFSAVPERAGPAAPEPDSVPAPVSAPATRPEISAAPAAGPATDIELPPGSEFNRSRPGTEARPPEAEETPREAPTMGAPAPVDVTEAPLPDTAPAAAPAPVSAMPETMAPPMGSDAALDLGGAASPAAEDPPPAARAMHGPSAPEAAAAPVPEPAAPENPREAAPATSPDASPAMPTGTSPDGSAATFPESSPEAAAGPAPETDPETVPDTSPETAPETALDSETVPEIAADPETGPEAEPAAAPETVPEVETVPEAGSEAPSVLPEVLPPPGPADAAMPGRAAGPLRPDAPLSMVGEKAAPVDAAPEATRSATPATPGALALNAVPFRAPPGAPLLSLVLIDIGAEGLDRQTLLTFPFPVTFVLDPAAPDAEAAMAAYREAGYEVAVLGSGLADLAPEAAAARLGEALDRIDGSIALVTPEEGGFEGDRDLSGAVLGVLEASGHGLVTADKGLNGALRAAEQAGLREAGIFQTLDDAGQDAETIRRMLNRAVLEARQTGHAVIVGHSHPETVTAIYAWALLSGPADAVLAPLSAVLRQSRP